MPGETHEEALKEIIDALDKLKADNAAYDYTLEITNSRPFLDIPEEDPFIQLTMKSYEQIMGKPVEIYRRPGGSDAANIREATGMPILNFGIGVDTESGTANEKVSVQGYLDFIKIYMMTVVNALSD